MAKGQAKHKLRQQQCSGLGKELSRRAKSRCELCSTRTALSVIELLPLPAEPNADWALLICNECKPLLAEKIVAAEPNRLQFVHETIWSEHIPVQVASVRVVRHLEAMQIPWVQGLLDTVYIDPSIEAKI